MICLGLKHVAFTVKITKNRFANKSSCVDPFAFD
jgi:hypothetical protein